MQVTDLPPSVQVLRRVFVGSSTSQVPSSLSIRVRPKSVSSELVSNIVQSKLAAIIETIPAKNVPVISQGEIVSQPLFFRRKLRVSLSIVRCAMVAMLFKSVLKLSSWDAIEAAYSCRIVSNSAFSFSLSRVGPALVLAVGRIGGNLNQIARWLNHAMKVGRADLDTLTVARRLVVIERQLAALLDEARRC